MSAGEIVAIVTALLWFPSVAAACGWQMKFDRDGDGGMWFIMLTFAGPLSLFVPFCTQIYYWCKPR